METQALDDLADDGSAVAHRARAREMLDQITRQAKQALSEQSIATPLFFIVPNSGDAVLTFGSPDDLDDELWDRVGKIVASVVAGLVGLRGTRRRGMQCATTDSVADHQSPQSSLQPTETSGCRLASRSVPALQAGADLR